MRCSGLARTTTTTEEHISSNTSTVRQAPRVIATVGLAAFLLVLAGEHALSAKAPAQHVISEYGRGPQGWIMRVGLAAWAVSLAATSALIRRASVAVPLLLAAAGLALTAIFRTQAVASKIPEGVTRTTNGALHDAGAGTAIVALFVAAVTSAATSSLAGRGRRTAVGLITTGCIVFGALLAAGDPAPGWRQRVLVAAAVGWQSLLLRASKPERRR